MKTILFTLVCLFSMSLNAQFVANVETVNLSTDSHIDGSGGDSLVSEEGFHFPIIWNDAWGFWAGGWAVSNQNDSSRRGQNGLFQSVTGSGYASNNYLVGQQNSEIYLDASANTPLNGLYITNTSFAYHSMNEGDQFAKKFGGIDGTDPDYFLLHILAKENGSWKADTVHFYLADFRNADPAKDSIIDTWVWLDLSKLGTADTLRFLLESSDTGDFGMNTPGFFAIDAISRSWQVSVQKVENPPLKLYPNPAGSHVYLSSETDWTIMDTQGKMILEGAGQKIDIQTLTSGVYLLRDGNGNSSRFIKK